MNERSGSVSQLCRRAARGAQLSETECARLLQARDDEAEEVFATARALRRQHFGDVVFLYGFVYFSTFCRNACSFCLYRAGNPAAPRYRKDAVAVVEVCRSLVSAGVSVVDLTMGEDPELRSDAGLNVLLDLVAAVRTEVDAAIMVSPGCLPDSALSSLHAHGADWYALYQETHSPELYRDLRVGQAYADRVAARASARRCGLLVEDGMLTGVGDLPGDRARSIVVMRGEGSEQVRVMSFVPQAGTPLADMQAPGDDDELLTIAVMRLAMPDRLIPASLDVRGLEGLEARIMAGANIVTSLVPPLSGLAGVSQAELGIDCGDRTVASVVPRLQALGLRAGTAAEYRDCLVSLTRRASAVGS
ncbi:MAG: methylornithine synthase PylB [Thermoleophilia bacterium]